MIDILVFGHLNGCISVFKPLGKEGMSGRQAGRHSLFSLPSLLFVVVVVAVIVVIVVVRVVVVTVTVTARYCCCCCCSY